MLVEFDTNSHIVTEKVKFFNIPQGGKMRFQQRFVGNIQCLQYDFDTLLWDTNDRILTLISPSFPKTETDTLQISFTMKMNDTISGLQWGEAALICETSHGKMHKQTSPSYSLYVKQQDTSLLSESKMFDGYYYVQVASLPLKHSKQDIAKQMHVQEGDVVVEMHTGKYYRYMIGHFATKEIAQQKLKYYRSYAKDAFIVK